MALSSYDLIAFDENGKQTDGIMEGIIRGTYCEIYKNWLYIKDKNGWVQGREFQKPIIAEIQFGHIQLCRFHIEAARGNQNSIFVNIRSMKYSPYKEHKMVGIGAYAFYPPYKKILKEENLDVDKWINLGFQNKAFAKEYQNIPEHEKVNIENSYIFTFRNKENKELISVERTGDAYDWQYVGILPETYKEFINWLKRDCNEIYYEWGNNKEFVELVEKIEKLDPLRFNQGDMYFANRLNFEVPATPIGEQEEPILIQMCKEGENT